MHNARAYLFALLVPLAALGACGSDDDSPRDAARDVALMGDAAVAAPDALAMDAGVDGVKDAPAADGPLADAGAVDAPAVDAPQGTDAVLRLAQVQSLLEAHCTACHNGLGTYARLLNLSDSPDAGMGLHERLLAPVPFEGFCGQADAGTDASAWAAIVPGSPESSLLYLKVMGTQPSPGAPPANCGVRMPRVLVRGPGDAGTTTVACDKASGGETLNCLSPEEAALLRQWIEQGAQP